jgi:hypothetical protein
MLNQNPLLPEVVMHHTRLVAREGVLLLGVTLIALLLQAGGHQIPVLMLDGALIFVGLIGLLAALVLGSKADRWWFIALAVIPMIAGITQLFWSLGLAVGFLVLIAIPPILDALANILILGLHIWLSFRKTK